MVKSTTSHLLAAYFHSTEYSVLRSLYPMTKSIKSINLTPVNPHRVKTAKELEISIVRVLACVTSDVLHSAQRHMS